MRALSKKAVFALGVVLDIAYNGGTDLVQSKEVSARQGVPKRYLEQVMQELVRGGMLKGVRGPRGGYRLARERRRISLGDIARVVGEAENGRDPVDAIAPSELGEKVMRPLCEELQSEIMERLDAISIEDLCRRARAREVRSAPLERLDFAI